MIEIRGLKKKYSRRIVINQIDGCFEPNLVHGILGPNGCGKTTLVKLMLGLVRPNDGEVLFNGKPLCDQRDQIAWLPQHPHAPAGTTPAKLFSLVESLRDRKAEHKETLIADFGFAPELDKPMGTLSGGNLQKCFLIATLMFSLPLLILDEPTVGLDPIAAAVFKKILKERAGHSTILLISHITSEIVQLSDQVHFLMDGRWAYHGVLKEIQDEPNFVDFETFLIQVLSGNEAKNEKI